MHGFEVDVAVVGGGIAGMSVAAELSQTRTVRVAVLEQEAQLAYHASGRSVAAFLESYGGVEVRALTRASRPIFDATGPDEAPLLTPRPLLWIAKRDDVAELDRLVAAEPLLRPLGEAEIRSRCPAIRPGWVGAGAVEEGAQDLDVAALYERYRRIALANGVIILTRATVQAGQRRGTGWSVRTEGGDIEAATVVNAAGAWADEVAARCEVTPVGLTALRRTVAVVASSAVDRSWPLVCDVAEGFYFRPEGSGLLLSPADETSASPGDARAEMEDVALALDRVNEATTLGLRRVTAAWAGLRTFARDRNPVVGFDGGVPGFFWLAGQGGYGMQTAPAMARLAASLILGEPPTAVAAEGLTIGALSPARFGARSAR